MDYRQIFAEYVLGTAPQLLIVRLGAVICQLESRTFQFLEERYGITSPDVYVSTWSLKHVYDERPDFISSHLDDWLTVFQRPDIISLAKAGHRA